MPLFKSHPDSPEPAPAPPTPPRKTTGSLFRRAPSPVSDYRSVATHATDDTRSVRSGFFFPRRRASADSLRSDARSIPASTAPSAISGTGSSSTFFGSKMSLKKYRAQNDPKVVMAREKIATAQEAEMEADRALLHARARVRDALTHIKVLEEEAKEEAMRAKAKQAESKVVSRHAGTLGRHG
ncbi:hypothetical protein B0H11DRAFT_1812259 [Mycena galericulata]|nr:hypothetical protein B0H11DRAFT_1812259 [Mycena galericulata]